MPLQVGLAGWLAGWVLEGMLVSIAVCVGGWVGGVGGGGWVGGGAQHKRPGWMGCPGLPPPLPSHLPSLTLLPYFNCHACVAPGKQDIRHLPHSCTT